MGLLDFMIGILIENERRERESKRMKFKEEFDCCYDCKDCPHSWECDDDGYYDDENDKDD